MFEITIASRAGASRSFDMGRGGARPRRAGLQWLAAGRARPGDWTTTLPTRPLSALCLGGWRSASPMADLSFTGSPISSTANSAKSIRCMEVPTALAIGFGSWRIRRPRRRADTESPDGDAGFPALSPPLASIVCLNPRRSEFNSSAAQYRRLSSISPTTAISTSTAPRTFSTMS